MPNSVSVDFLLNGSKLSMEEAMLRRLADASCRRKQLLELLDLLVECQAEVLLLEWFMEHGNALMGSVTASATVTQMELPELPEKPSPMSATELRANLERLLESA